VPDEEPRSTADSGWRTFVRLLGFLSPYRASLIVSSALAILSQIAAILVPVLIGVVVNELDGGKDTQLLVLEIGRSSRSGSSAAG
jgi:ABC-type multidrug transport system fused ATPase/permease subunit